LFPSHSELIPDSGLAVSGSSDACSLLSSYKRMWREIVYKKYFSAMLPVRGDMVTEAVFADTPRGL
jgi:hypothetical protein